MLKKYELLNMFFHRYSYKNSCFSKLVYNSIVLSYKDVMFLKILLQIQLVVFKACTILYTILGSHIGYKYLCQLAPHTLENLVKKFMCHHQKMLKSYMNSCLTFTFYKTHHGPVIAPFSVQILKCTLLFLLATLDVPY